MAIPVYVITGFLDAGKTTLLNSLLNRHDWRDVSILVIQFESGEREFESRYDNKSSISFSKRTLDHQPEQVIEQIYGILRSRQIDEIWIEWNGVAPFSQLQSLLLQPALRGMCIIRKVIFVSDAVNMENLLGRTGGALPEQIANCDFAVVRNARSMEAINRIKHLVHGINPSAGVYGMKAYNDLYKQLFGKKERPFAILSLTIAAIVFLAAVLGSLLEPLRAPVNTFINIFLGIILQAVPFLLIGVLLSSAIQILIPRDMIERRFPKSIVAGMLVAILGGFCLPVCDCASIPIFRSLVRKGIPLPVAVTFMTATPVINPVVILSTYFAFSGDMTIVLSRVGFGILASIIIGISFVIWPAKGKNLSGGALDRLMCSCGCYEDAESITTLGGKLGLFFRHSQAEFFSVGKFLLIGTFISTLFQMLGTSVFAASQNGAGLFFSILVMMAMAFALSLCSSSDAVIARSLANQFPHAAIMGFLVFGPMMDIKNVLMLSSGFTKQFIGKLLLTTFIACFFVVFLLSGLGGV